MGMKLGVNYDENAGGRILFKAASDRRQDQGQDKTRVRVCVCVCVRKPVIEAVKVQTKLGYAKKLLRSASRDPSIVLAAACIMVRPAHQSPHSVVPPTVRPFALFVP